ncbi:MAG: insulinase family protein [Calditrichaeota bacterium]|nr:insulinase family protein [Calditrichota bacterium]
MDQNIKKTVFSDGLTVISEQIPAVRSISIGVWVKTGSRYEHIENNGVAHFIEHLVFKGTKKRSSLQIARSLEDLGGSLNAYTSKEITNFYAFALDSHLPVCVNVLADLICNPLFREKDIEKEKQVIFEEISSVKDTPDEYIYDLFQEKLFPEDSLGLPILGVPEIIEKLTSKDVLSFWKRFYTPDNMVIAAAGNLDHEKLLKLVERYFHFEQKGTRVKFKKPVAANEVNLQIREPFNQAHIIAGIEGLSYKSEDRYDLIALNSYLGAGMSSRLFQTIREHHGLAYTVYSSVDFFRDTGIFSFYMGTDRKKRGKALNLLFKEIKKVTENRISESIVARIREQLKGHLLLGLESTSRRMSRLAKNEIYFGRQIPISEMIDHIDAITAERLLILARSLFNVDKFNIIQMSSDA